MRPLESSILLESNAEPRGVVGSSKRPRVAATSTGTGF